MTSWASYKNLYRAHGFRRVWTHIRETSLFDWRYGTDTGTWLPLSAYTQADIGMKHYQASFTREILRCFRLLADITDTRPYTFYDIGCGKGKILILAHKHLPCAGIIGVELNPALAATARKNLEKLKLVVTVTEANARDYPAYAPQSIVYICDPFDEDTLHAMLNNIKNACEDCILIYNNPAYDMTRSGFAKLKETGGWHANYRSGIYRFQKEKP